VGLVRELLWNRHRPESPSSQAGALLEGGSNMLWTLFVILLVLWLLGMVSSYTLGGFIHVLLVVAVIILLLRLFSGRTVV
jgi:hypothetical protein